MPDKASQQTATVRDRRAPFLLITKDFFKLQPSALAIAAYCALLYYASSSKGSCERISILTLTRIARISETSMKKALAELKTKGAIKIRHRSTKTLAGKRIPLANLYEILDINPGGGPLI